MAEVLKVLIEDEKGNIHYPHTTADVVFTDDGKDVEQVIKDLAEKKHTHHNKSVIDKVTQDMLDKLAGIETGANKYIHPDTHAASMITQDATHRFTTDAEKTKWNEITEVKQSLEKYASMTVSGEILNLPGGGSIAVTGETLSIPLKI